MLRYILAIVGVLGFTTQSIAQQATGPIETHFCSGGPSGNYYMAGQEIAGRLPKDMFSVTVEKSGGSLANLRRLTGAGSTGEVPCQLGFSQSDVSGEYGIENPAARDQVSVLRIAYTEYTHILCPVSSGWNSLTDIANAKGSRRMIVGPDGSGTAETWRILRQVDNKLFDPIERIADPADISSAHTVADSNDTCMLWVSGLNSSDMQSANALSIRNPTHKPSMRLISVDDKRFVAIKGLNGQPLYKIVTVSPKAASGGKPALYDNLINNGGMFSSASIDVLAVPANIMIRNDFKTAIGRDRLARMYDAIDDAQPTIWGKVNPAGTNGD